jgi:hypothetical protein
MAVEVEFRRSGYAKFFRAALERYSGGCRSVFVLAAKVVDVVGRAVGGFGSNGQPMVCGTAGPGQGQLREFYLTAVEAVDPGLREKYAKIYRNY